ncbi:MAG: dipeptide epimerase [Candidatus Bathyarchaeia archaeon]
MRILDVSIDDLEISFRKPLKTSLCKFEKLENIILRLNTGSLIGFGEASPTLAVTGDTPDTVKALLKELAATILEGADPLNLLDITRCLDKIPYNGSAKAAIDVAVHDLIGKFYRIPVFAFLGGSSKRLETDVTISLGEPEEMCNEAERWVDKGFKTLKLKLGSTMREDLQRVKHIRDRVGSSLHLTADLNQAYTRRLAIRFISKVEPLDVDFIEQPLPAWDLKGLAQIRKVTGFPIAVDESVHTSRDLLKVLDYKAADLVNIKLMKGGGIREGLKIAAIAERAGLECMIGCMAESRLSITAAVHLACAAPSISYIDLDSPLFLERDPVVGGAKYDGPYIEPGIEYGLGVTEIR